MSTRRIGELPQKDKMAYNLTIICDGDQMDLERFLLKKGIKVERITNISSSPVVGVLVINDKVGE